MSADSSRSICHRSWLAPPHSSGARRCSRFRIGITTFLRPRSKVSEFAAKPEGPVNPIPRYFGPWPSAQRTSSSATSRRGVGRVTFARPN